MAIEYRLYRSPEIGTGTRMDPFRSKLTQYVSEDGTGAGFWDWLNPIASVRYALVACDSAVHTAIEADPDMTALSPVQPDTASIETWLDTPATDFDGPIATAIETDKCSVAWKSANSTHRDVLRYLSRHHVFLQRLKGDGRAAILTNLRTRTLSTTWNQLTAAQRTAVIAWMAGKGLATGWITNPTTLRQIFHFIIENINWPTLGWAGVRL